MAKKWPKWGFLWDKMAILSPIGLKIGLPITLDRIDGQNKLEGCISKNMAKMAKKWLKISRAATFGQSWDGHNLVILHPIWTFDPTKIISSSRRIDWWKDLSSIYVRSKNWIFGHFWPKMALVGGQKIEILNFYWLVLVYNPFRSYNFSIIKILLKKWKLCYTLLCGLGKIYNLLRKNRCFCEFKIA